MPAGYDEPANVRWQTRTAAEPGAYALELAESLEAVFEAGAEEIEDIVARLNERGPPPEGAERWTPAVFEAEMVRLGA